MLQKDASTKIPRKDFKGDLPKNEDGWIKYVNDLHDQGINVRQKYELSWTLNHAYAKGYQDIVFNYKTGRIEVPKTMARPLTVNKIGSFLDARLSKLTKQRPIPRVIPSTGDNEDVNAAKYSDHVLMHLWRKTEIEAEYESYIMMGLTYGTSFMRVLWNPFGGDYFKRAAGKEEEILEIQDGEIKEEKIFLGEVDTKAISPFSIIPANENIREIKDQPWMMERTFHSVSDLEKFYPHLRGKLIGKAKNRSERTDYEGVIARLGSPVSSAIGSAIFNVHDSINDEVLCKKLWIKPNSQYENGVVVIVVGDQLAHIGAFPHDYGPNIYPYVKFTERTDGVHFWEQATVERLLSIQKAYNRLKQKKLKNIYLMSAGKWLIAKGSQIAEDSLTDEEGEVIEYNSSVNPPAQAGLAPLPNYAVEMARELTMDFRTVSGQSDTPTNLPPGVTASVAMETLAELSDEIINPILKRLGRCMTRVAKAQLLIINEEYIEPRKVAIVGEGNSYGVQYISAADLKHNTDVHIEVESMFPSFRGNKQQRLLELWDRRIITDPSTFLKAYRFGNLDEILSEIEETDDPVWLDIAQLKKGKMPEITPWQNHMAYFKIISKWVQTPEFMAMIPERKQMALDLLQGHLSFLLQSLPNRGAETPQTNQAAVGTPFGPQKTVGSPGAGGPT
tara:strand:- start:336 stop:2354 length:2019 start_codon:yes stop_codon:yes gene_type:complete